MKNDWKVIKQFIRYKLGYAYKWVRFNDDDDQGTRGWYVICYEPSAKGYVVLAVGPYATNTEAWSYV